MKVTTEGSALKLNNIEKTAVQSMSIKANPALFALLSKGLYNNPILAVIREVSCNAYDSHVMAGYPEKPITVKLPSALSPEFVVSDEGVGMSEQEVYNLFYTLGSSNKQDSNDCIGGFGLGSKSPFAVSDVFTLEASKEGTRNVFICSKDEVGMPKIVKVYSEPTVTTGVTVRVPVESNHSSWLNLAKDFFKFWDVKPNGVEIDASYSPVEVPTKYKHLIDPILKGVSLYSRLVVKNDVSVRMGNVVYPVSDKYTGGVLKNRRVVLDYPIGHFQVTPSRESLIVTDSVRKEIGDKLEQVSNSLFDTLYNRSLLPACDCFLLNGVLLDSNIGNDYKTVADAPSKWTIKPRRLYGSTAFSATKETVPPIVHYKIGYNGKDLVIKGYYDTYENFVKIPKGMKTTEVNRRLAQLAAVEGVRDFLEYSPRFLNKIKKTLEITRKDYALIDFSNIKVYNLENYPPYQNPRKPVKPKEEVEDPALKVGHNSCYPKGCDYTAAAYTYEGLLKAEEDNGDVKYFVKGPVTASSIRGKGSNVGKHKASLWYVTERVAEKLRELAGWKEVVDVETAREAYEAVFGKDALDYCVPYTTFNGLSYNERYNLFLPFYSAVVEKGYKEVDPILDYAASLFGKAPSNGVTIPQLVWEDVHAGYTPLSFFDVVNKEKIALVESQAQALTKYFLEEVVPYIKRVYGEVKDLMALASFSCGDIDGKALLRSKLIKFNKKMMKKTKKENSNGVP